MEPLDIEEEVKTPSYKNNEFIEEEKCFDTYQALPFTNASEFLAVFDEEINSGRVTLYKWQVEDLDSLSNTKSNSQHPHKYCLCAANGSGKDKYIIAPWSIFFICCKVRSLVVITSSSGVQLTNQTETYIRLFAEKVNAITTAMPEIGKPILKIRQRYIYCMLSGSIIRLFVTDEEGKAEGYHPLESNAEMCIILNEAKSIPTGIFRALRRCTGYNYWIDVSTPGEPKGDFYKHWLSFPNKRRVTFFDCPHLSVEDYETDKRELGEHDSLFRSKHLALFTFVGGKTVIDANSLETMRQRAFVNQIKWVDQERVLPIGIDVALSKYGDETVLTAFKGNKQTHLLTHRIGNVTKLADAVEIDLLNKIKIKKTHQLNIDDGNVGRALADTLVDRGWKNICRILNQSTAKHKKFYRNRGAEMWYKMQKFVEAQCLILLDDDKLYEQLISRKFLERDTGIDKLTLQSKPDMISEGLPSPDRADSVVLVFANESVEHFKDLLANVLDESISATTLTKEEKIQQLMEDIELNGIVRHNKVRKGSRYSLNSAFNNQRINQRLLKYM